MPDYATERRLGFYDVAATSTAAGLALLVGALCWPVLRACRRPNEQYAALSNKKEAGESAAESGRARGMALHVVPSMGLICTICDTSRCLVLRWFCGGDFFP